MPPSVKDIQQLRAMIKNDREKIDQLEERLGKTMKILHGLIQKLQESKYANILDPDPKDTPGVPVQPEGAGSNEGGN
jgi:hypothetical protein